MKKFLTIILAVGFLMSLSSFLQAATITFDSLPGNTGDLITDPLYMESDFRVRMGTNEWNVDKIFGKPIPDIYLGPPLTNGVVLVSMTNGGDFTFSSVDLASTGGLQSGVKFTGYLDSSLVFDTFTINVPSLSPHNFVNVNNPFPAAHLDALNILVYRGFNVTSVNLDNIVVTCVGVPEPGILILLGISMASVVGLRRRWKN